LKKYLVAMIVLALLLTGTALAGQKPSKVNRLCVNVETGTEYPSYGDLNLYRGDKHICIVGRRGPAGKNGKNGLAGARGAAGLNGAAGVAGAQGERGVAGQDGAKGETGVTGAQGERGPAGENGAPGPAGPQGETGATGAVGPAGATGPAGPTGPQGPAGSGLGNGMVYACVNDNGNSWKFGGPVDGTPDCDPGHDGLILKLVVVTP
jgi:collagen triple helix repeat protein